MSHRYLGIPLSIMFVVWFISGIVMIYTEGFPTITPAQRLSKLEPVDMQRIAVSAADAWAQAGMRDVGVKAPCSTRPGCH